MKWKIGAFAVLLMFAATGVQVAGLNGESGAPMAFDADAEPTFDGATNSAEEDPPTTGPVQEDAGIPGDAPADCSNVDARRFVEDDGDDIHALLVEFDDEQDTFIADTADTNARDGRVRLTVTPGVDQDIQRLALDVFAVNCGESVLDPTSSHYDRIGPDAGAGEGVVEATLDGKCKDEGIWHFKLNGLDSIEHPAHVFVEWTNGATEWVALKNSDSSAHYVTSSHLGFTLRSVEAVVPEGWDSKFWVHTQPCNQVDGGAEPVERQVPAPFQDGLYAEWEARHDAYVIVVTLDGGVADATDGANTLLKAAGASDAGLMQTCHRECFGVILYQIELASF